MGKTADNPLHAEPRAARQLKSKPSVRAWLWHVLSS
jgi:hypothetical protein